MKANLENLIKVVEISAKAHFVGSEYDKEDNTIYVFSDNVPVFSDIRMIAKAFFGTNDVVDNGLATTFIDLNNLKYLDEVDMDTLEWALPNGALKEVA